jgi:citrate synthase
VIAGLAALEGTRHGGTTARIEAAWDSLRRARDLRAALTDKLRRGEPIEGFGHRLYAHFALVAVARSLGLPSGAALTLFAIGRTIGWIAHALEQYAEPTIIRPRAKYVGEAPAAAPVP